MKSLEDEAGIYGCDLYLFAEESNLPEELFRFPDHIVLRAADTSSMEEVFQDEIAPNSKLAVCVEVEPRLKVAAELTGRLAVYTMGEVDWIEINEPSLEHSRTILKRVEFYSDSLESTKTILGVRGLYSDIIPEKNRAYIGVKTRTPRGSLEFRFTDTTLSDITHAKLDEEEAIRISLAKRSAA